MNTFEYATPGETAMAIRIVDKALAKGWSISVNDGEEWTVKRSTCRDEILAAMNSTDHDILRFRDENGPVGDVMLVYGNAQDGSELMADASMDDGGEFDVFTESIIRGY